MKKEKQIKHIAKKIESKLGFTNGWRISDEDYASICKKLAKDIHKYLTQSKQK